MQSGQRKIECTETITRREPADLHGIPEGIVVHFDREIVGAGMCKQSQQHMQDFRNFAEQGKDVREERR